MKTLLEELLAGEFEYPTIKDYILKTKSGVTVILANHNTTGCTETNYGIFQKIL